MDDFIITIFMIQGVIIFLFGMLAGYKLNDLHQINRKDGGK